MFTAEGELAGEAIVGTLNLTGTFFAVELPWVYGAPVDSGLEGDVVEVFALFAPYC